MKRRDGRVLCMITFCSDILILNIVFIYFHHNTTLKQEKCCVCVVKLTFSFWSLSLLLWVVLIISHSLCRIIQLWPQSSDVMSHVTRFWLTAHKTHCVCQSAVILTSYKHIRPLWNCLQLNMCGGITMFLAYSCILFYEYFK